jgi:HAD superfamily hydrolase (TIGR01509 family)
LSNWVRPGPTQRYTTPVLNYQITKLLNYQLRCGVRLPLKAIFFDAGGTLVFPDLSLTLAPLAERGVSPSQEQLYAAEREAKHRLDEARAQGIQGVDATYWDVYYGSLLRQLGWHDPELQAALVTATRRGMNWTVMRPGTRSVLERLHARFRVGLISNSDGSVCRLLHELGIGHCFDSCTDSFHCGCEKPDPRIFRTALSSLGAGPEKALYLGDIYSVDYVGARSVGIRAMLMDPAGAYEGTEWERVRSLEELEKRLAP